MLKGKNNNVGFTLAEDVDGNLFYNLSQIEEAPSNLPAQTMAGESGLHQGTSELSKLPAVSMAGESSSLFEGTSVPLESTIPIDGDNVNMLLQEKTLSCAASPPSLTARGVRVCAPYS